MSKVLYRELSRRIFGQFGAIPGGIGSSMTTDENLVKHIKVSEKGSHVSCPVWAFECQVAKVMIVDVSGGKGHEFAMVVSLGDQTTHGAKFIWNDDDYGLFFLRAGDAWLESALWQVLALATSIEVMISQGAAWLPMMQLDQQLYGQLISLVEYDVVSDSET